jgi:hypothetical protein
MSSEPASDDVETDPPLPQDNFSDQLLTAELEPTADGDQRALLYPEDRSGSELATCWLATPADTLVDLDDVR